MKNPFEFLAEMICKRPFLAAGLIILILIAALYGFTMVSMKTGTETYLNLDEPVGSLVDHYSSEFGSSSIILIIEGEALASPDVIKYLDSLEEDFRDERYIAGVSGLASFMKSANNGVLPRSPAEINNILDNSGDASSSVLPSPTLSMMYINLDSGLSQESEMGLVDMTESVLECYKPPAGVTITVSGNPAFSVQMQQDMMSNTVALIGLALILMIVAMVFLFGHVRYRMLPVFTVFCGIILTFGVMGFAGLKMRPVVVAAFPVLIGIGIDYGIQLHSRLDEEIQKTSSVKDAVFITVVNSGPAVLLAMIATSLGFFALNLLAPAPMVADFGTICIIGVSCCYITRATFNYSYIHGSF